jgi:hypothetical protein
MKKYNIVSFGISDEQDFDFLEKQYILFDRYCKEEFSFSTMVSREQFRPTNSYQDLLHTLQSVDEIEVAYIPEYLQDDYNIATQGTSQFTGEALTESVHFLPKAKHFFVHLDCLPIAPFSLEELFGDVVLGGVPQVRGSAKYLWDCCLYVDMNRKECENINFRVGKFGGELCDTGGGSYEVLEKLSDDEKIYYPNTYYLNSEENIEKLDIEENVKHVLLENYKIQYGEQQKFGEAHWSELHMGRFFHYRSFSGWHRKDSETLKMKQKRKDLLLSL